MGTKKPGQLTQVKRLPIFLVLWLSQLNREHKQKSVPALFKGSPVPRIRIAFPGLLLSHRTHYSNEKIVSVFYFKEEAISVNETLFFNCQKVF